MSRRWVLLATLVALVALLAAACGSSSQTATLAQQEMWQQGYGGAKDAALTIDLSDPGWVPARLACKADKPIREDFSTSSSVVSHAKTVAADFALADNGQLDSFWLSDSEAADGLVRALGEGAKGEAKNIPFFEGFVAGDCSRAGLG